jgi:chemotaxis protein methyltransferase CheR
MAALVKNALQKLQRASLSEDEFRKLQCFAKEHWGFEISPTKKNLVENRLMSFCREKKLASASEVLGRLFVRNERELEILVFDTLSTNLTSFFRDPSQFQVFDKEVLEPFAHSRGRPFLQIWSAGCSSGCEPYSLAIRCKEILSQDLLAKVKILGTDYSVSVLQQAKGAVYPKETTKEVHADLLRRHFLKGVGNAEGKVKLKNEVKKLVSFSLLNLMEPWPGLGPFDAIFCRNVMIYFGEEVQASLIKRFAKLLTPGGLLFVGSAESFSRISSGLISVGPSIFRKPGGDA